MFSRRSAILPVGDQNQNVCNIACEGLNKNIGHEVFRSIDYAGFREESFSGFPQKRSNRHSLNITCVEEQSEFVSQFLSYFVGNRSDSEKPRNVILTSGGEAADNVFSLSFTTVKTEEKLTTRLCSFLESLQDYFPKYREGLIAGTISPDDASPATATSATAVSPADYSRGSDRESTAWR